MQHADDEAQRRSTRVTIGLYLLSAFAVLGMGWMPGTHEQDLHRFSEPGAAVLLICAVLAAYGQRNGWRWLIQASVLLSNALVSVTVWALRHYVGDAYEIEIFYLLPLLIAAHFHGPRFVHLSIAACVFGHPLALAAAPWRTGASRVDIVSEAIARSIPVCAVMASVTVLMHRMRTRDLHQRELLRSEATTDPLTKLANRRGLRQAIDAGAASAGATVVVMADLDRFKEINDTEGHAIGDRVLCAMAEALVGATERTDVAVRFGGEEFLLLLPNRSIADAESIAAEVATALRHRSPSATPTTASFGITEWIDGEAFSEAVQRADGAVYAAKSAGRDRVRYEAARPSPAGAAAVR